MMLRYNVIALLVCAALLSACDNGEYDYKDLNCSKGMVCQTKSGKPVTGMVKTYYPDGELKRTITYVKGLREGMMTDYYKNGVIKAEVMYHNNLVDGSAKAYYENGVLAGDCNYTCEKLDGSCALYNEDGSLDAEETYHNGIENREVLRYMNRVAVLKSEFKNGVLIAREVYDENGAVQSKIFADNAEEINRYQTYYPNGAMKIDAETTGGKVEGKVKEYYDNGQLKSEYQVRGGGLIGDYTAYRKNGNISFAATYQEGKVPEGEERVQAAVVEMKLRFMRHEIKNILDAN